MHQLFGDPDLTELNLRMSYHSLEEQAELVANGGLDIAAFVMRSDAEFLRSLIRQNDLDIIELQNLPGLVSRYPWLTIGRIPAARFDLVRQIPQVDRSVPQVNTLVVANQCAKRSDRIEFLVLLSAELSGFVRGNPPGATSSATALPLSSEARQFFVTGEPEFSDRYFPWLVNLMSPVYWVYLTMIATALFNAMKGYSHFRLWRIDVAREGLEAEVRGVVGDVVSHAPTIDILNQKETIDPKARLVAHDILDRLAKLRIRCQRQANSFATPMGEEMLYRFQQSLIDNMAAKLKSLINSSSSPK
jgi:hypothetical protein